MQYFTVTKEFKEALKQNPMDNIVANIMDNISDDLRIVIRAGCKIDTIIEGNKITIKSHFPVSILKNDKGQVIDVIELRK